MKLMNVKITVIGIMALLMAMPAANAQKVLDGAWVKENTPTRRVVPYTHVREADVMWHKRIWRTIDLREKINHPLYYPTSEMEDRKSLFQALKKGIEEGTITAYGNAALDDEFTEPLTIAQAQQTLGDTVRNMIENLDNPGTFEEVVSYEEVPSAEIKRYRIKEDWFFDRERSIMDVRIIGIAPMRETYEADMVTVKGYKPLFWVYFPEARYVLANYDVFNRHNDAERRTFEDIFWKRRFSSYIIKQSNVYDRYISDYKTGIDKLLKAEEVKNDIFIMEHDLWSY